MTEKQLLKKYPNYKITLDIYYYFDDDNNVIFHTEDIEYDFELIIKSMNKCNEKYI